MKKLIALLLVFIFCFFAVAEAKEYIAKSVGQDEDAYYVYEIKLTTDDFKFIYNNKAASSWHKSYRGDPYVTKQNPENYGKEFYWTNCIIQCKRKVKNDGKWELKSAGFYVDYKTKRSWWAAMNEQPNAKTGVTVRIHIKPGENEVYSIELNGVLLEVW